MSALIVLDGYSFQYEGVVDMEISILIKDREKERDVGPVVTYRLSEEDRLDIIEKYGPPKKNAKIPLQLGGITKKKKGPVK